MKWIEFGECDYKIIIPLIYPFTYEIRRLFHDEDERFLFGFFANFCGYLFSGVIYLIIKYRMQKIKNNNDFEKNLVQEKEIELSEQNLNDKTSIKMVSTVRFSKNQLSLNKEKFLKMNIKKQYLF